MIKLIGLLTFRSDLDPDWVREWWKTEHGALALKDTRMRRYVQNHFVTQSAAGGELQFQGVIEAWFDSMEDYELAMQSPEWAALRDDGPNGFDMAKFQGGLVIEHVMRWDADSND